MSPAASLIGLLAGLFGAWETGQHTRLFLITGFLGGFTTFSAFSLDALTLWERGAFLQAGLYVAGQRDPVAARRAAGTDAVAPIWPDPCPLHFAYPFPSATDAEGALHMADAPRRTKSLPFRPIMSSPRCGAGTGRAAASSPASTGRSPGRPMTRSCRSATIRCSSIRSARPTGRRSRIMLEELLAAGHAGAEYDAWYIDIGEGDQFGSGFVELNPNSQDSGAARPVRSGTSRSAYSKAGRSCSTWPRSSAPSCPRIRRRGPRR